MLTAVVAFALIGALAALVLLASVRASARVTASAQDVPVTERSEVVHAATDEATAAHEAGHVILAWASPFVMGVTSVTLNDDGESGVTSMVRGEVHGQARLWDAIAISLAGIAAEGYAFGRFSTSGSHGDLKKARDWAEELVAQAKSHTPEMPWRAPTSRSTIDIGLMFEERPSEATCAVLNTAYRHAKSVLAMRPDAFQALARAIRTHGTLSEDDLTDLLGPRPWAIFAPKK